MEDATPDENVVMIKRRTQSSQSYPIWKLIVLTTAMLLATAGYIAPHSQSEMLMLIANWFRSVTNCLFGFFCGVFFGYVASTIWNTDATTRLNHNQSTEVVKNHIIFQYFRLITLQTDEPRQLYIANGAVEIMSFLDDVNAVRPILLEGTFCAELF